jgi:hydroxypyruvate isomerase
MLKFSANLSFLFSEDTFLDRFSAAARAGFSGVEFLFHYDLDKSVLAEVMLTSGVEVVQFNLPAGNWAAGERGIACLPERKAEFQAGVGQAIEYAEALGCTRLNCLAGIIPASAAVLPSPTFSANHEKALETLIDNLRFAAVATQRAGIRLLLEPVNNLDNPGFSVPTTALALRVLDAVDSRNLQLLYDLYHAQMMEGNLIRTLETHLARIGHIHIADNPGRHEPGTGEINFPFLLRRLEQFGYTGWVGCEYKPSGVTQDSLGWLADWR